nr:hypothetical protein [Candidatus Sigynarchaeota archaeon]
MRRKTRAGLKKWLKIMSFPVRISYDKLKEWLLDPANVTGPIATLLYDLLIGNFIKATNSNREFRELIGDFDAKINLYTKDKSVARCLIIDGKGRSSSLKHLVDNPDAEIIFNSPREMILTLLFIIDIYQDLVDDTISIKGNPNVIYRYLFLITYLNPLVRKIKVTPSS